ncbi:MAG: type III-A CRISPR-associated protein Cas10/Csm1 [Phycisphaerae bacterium]
MDKEYNGLIIGAFLHDIGKIGQRAKLKLSQQSESMIPQACKLNPKTGFYGYKHVPYTNQFFEDYHSKDWLPMDKIPSWQFVANCATYHHFPQPEQVLEVIAQEADCLSAGHDREEEGRTVNQFRLDSIFSMLQFGDNNGSPDVKKHCISKSMLRQETFPANADDENSNDELSKMYPQMVEHFSRLSNSTGLSFDLYLEDLKWVYSQYAWCIPSSLRNSAEVSLLDHSLTTAAISSALYRYHKETGTLNEKSVKDRDIEKFCLVSGDVNGIQDYIFDDYVSNPKGVGKRLRAKSFYISTLTQICSMLILRDLNLPCFCKIIDAGGRFTLLVHNTDSTAAKLASLQKEIDSWLFKNLSGKLRINLSFDTRFSGSKFLNGKFGSVFNQLSHSIETSKKKQFVSIMQDSGKWNSEAMVHRPDSDAFLSADKIIRQRQDFFEELGRCLPGESHLVVVQNGKSNPGPLKNSSPLATPFGRCSIQVTDYNKNTGASDSDVLFRCSFVPCREDFADIIDGQYITNYVPRIKQDDLAYYRYIDEELDSEDAGRNVGDTKTFAHIAKHSLSIDANGEPFGQAMLGILKADVDNLGMVFSKGLGPNKTISRIATMSRLLDMFFKGILPNLIKEGDSDERFKNIYTIYAGGDDLLLAGPWDVVIDFAGYMREQFKEFTAGNTNITLSAGIAVVKPSFPLSEAARIAEEALEKSKTKDDAKNKITVFGETLSWDDFKEAVENGKFIYGQIKEESSAAQDKDSLCITSSFAYRLIKFARMGIRCREGSVNLADAKWRSQLCYDMARNISSNLNSEQLSNKDKLIQITGDNNPSKLLVAATFCNYKKRR